MIRFTVDIDTFVPVCSSIFTRSFAVVLGLICTFRTKVRSSLAHRTRLLPERYDGCMVPCCLYLRTIVCTDECGTFGHLEIAPKDEPDLWRSTGVCPNLFVLLSAVVDLLLWTGIWPCIECPCISPGRGYSHPLDTPLRL
jgi:hypothetical protein